MGRVPVAVLAAAAVAGGCGAPKAEPPPVKRLVASTDDLDTTTVVAHRGSPLDPGTNTLWCAAFPLAWDALKDGPVGGPLRLGPPAPAHEVAALNAGDFPAAALDPTSFVAVGGFFADGVVGRVHEALREKFGAAAPQPVFERPPGEKAALGYAFLRKDLPFEHPFEAAPNPLRFAGGTKSLASFGILPDSRHPDARAIRAQGKVLFAHHAGEGGGTFALEFAPKGGRDRMILAVVQPGGSLAAIWKGVAGKAAADPPLMPADAVLQVPRMDFRLDHRFRELVGAPLRNPGWEGYTIWEARETILFELSEAGARLEAEARVSVGRAASPEPPHRFVFDRPFLLALVEAGKEDPYFLMWVANDEILAEAH